MERVIDLTVPRPIRGTDKLRGHVFRFERAQISNAYWRVLGESAQIGKDLGAWKESARKFRQNAHALAATLDVLNLQYWENVQNYSVETHKIGAHSIPVVELDLNPESEDRRIPYFIIGGITSNHHQTAALSEALALTGQKVYVLTYPEQEYASSPPNWLERLKKDGTFKPHAELIKEVIKKMGLDRVNLLGWSLGAGVALEIATDNEFVKSYVQDLIVMEPVGLEHKAWPRVAFDFAVREGYLNILRNPETRAKAWDQGADTVKEKQGSFLAVANILRKKQLSLDQLGRINPQGRYEVWLGTKSRVVSAKKTAAMITAAEKMRFAHHPSASPVEIYRIEGGTHSFPFTNSLGVARLLTETRDQTAQPTTIKVDQLENSALSLIAKS